MLRKWWVVAGLGAGLLIGLLGGLVGGGNYRATAILQVTSDSPDSNRVNQLAQSTAALAQSAGVLNEAAKSRGVAVADLRLRTTARSEQGTDMVEVTVSGASAASAMADANTVAEQVVANVQARSTGQLEQLQKGTEEAVTKYPLRDAEAELARRQSLGQSVGAAQSSAINSGTIVQVLDRADGAESLGLSPLLSMLIGLVGGGLVGSGAALTLNRGRLPLRGNEDIATLAPELALTSSRPATQATANFLGSSDRTLTVLALPGAETAAQQIARRSVAVGQERGNRVELVDAWEPGPNRFRAFAANGDEGLRQVVVCPADEACLDLAAGQESMSYLLVATAGTSLADVTDVAAALGTDKTDAIVV